MPALCACQPQYAVPGIVVTDSDGHPHARCPVCTCEADLACIDVTVDGQTPHTVYKGQDYYFCSTGCLERFEKDPAKYTAH